MSRKTHTHTLYNNRYEYIQRTRKHFSLKTRKIFLSSSSFPYTLFFWQQWCSETMRLQRPQRENIWVLWLLLKQTKFLSLFFNFPLYSLTPYCWWYQRTVLLLNLWLSKPPLLVTFLACAREMPRSKLDTDTDYSDYTLITNLMHWLLFIHKILFSSTCFEHQVLIFRRI